jgi:hypothetical protein
MLANREGLFNAYPADIGVGETSQNKLVQVVISYRLFEELGDGQWLDCSGENLEISGYHVLEKKDHALNTSTIDALKAALGWDGCDPFWLQDNAKALAQQPVQVKLAFEEYNGQTTLKVAFLNPYGSRGGVPKADDSLRRDVANRLGMQFRAISGGSPAPAPKPATRQPAGVSPKTPPQSTPRASLSPGTAAPTATMDQAWHEFNKHCPPEWDQAAIEKSWFRILAELFPGKQPDQISPTEWHVMMTQCPAKIVTIPTGDDIPF